MVDQQDVSRLADRRYASVIVRVLLDERQHLIHGEVIDAQGRQGARFTGWRELGRTVRLRLTAEQRDSPGDAAPGGIEPARSLIVVAGSAARTPARTGVQLPTGQTPAV